MTQLFQCPECGYRNYVTRQDLDGERGAVAGAVARRMKERFERHCARQEWRSRHPYMAWLSILREILEPN